MTVTKVSLMNLNYYYNNFFPSKIKKIIKMSTVFLDNLEKHNI